MEIVTHRLCDIAFNVYRQKNIWYSFNNYFLFLVQTFAKFTSEVMPGNRSAVPTPDQLVWSYGDLESNGLDYCREAEITASSGADLVCPLSSPRRPL